MRRTAVALLMSSLGAAACSNSSGPAPPVCSSAQATHLTLAVGGYASVDPASDAGCVAFAANPSAIDSAEYLVVPQSAAGTYDQSALFQLRSATLAAARLPAAQRLIARSSPAHRLTAVQFDGFLRRVGRTPSFGRATPAGPAPGPAAATLAPAGPPINLRTFSVCANLSCSTFTSVTARVANVGMHIAIYVDTLAPTPGLGSADLDALKQVFDTLLYPLDTTTFGPVSDIDSNSVVIVLMTNVVNKLVSSTVCKTSGFVAGFFFPNDLDLTAPTSQSNHGEIFYSIVADPTGTLSCAHDVAHLKLDLPGTFTHELQHMINYNLHVLVNKIGGEDGWLDEGLSKYAEELAGRRYLQQGDSTTFSHYAINDVFDAYEYLSAPDTSALLIQFDQGTLAEIGASWLFVRYLVDQYGDSLPGKLDRAPLVGSANVAAQTGQAFPTLIARWGLANWVSDLPGFTTPAELTYTHDSSGQRVYSWHFRTRTFKSLNAQDPQDFPLPYPLVPSTTAGTAVNLSGMLRSGSGAYQRALQGPGAPAFTLSLSGTTYPFPAGLAARFTVIRIR